MIVRLQRRLTLLVICVLVLVTLGIIGGIHYANVARINTQAAAALQALAATSGKRPDMKSIPEPPEKPSGNQTENSRDDRPDRKPFSRGMQPGQLMDSADAIASLSNYYTITLDETGSVSSWSSDRSGLYTDQQIAELAGQISESGTESGRIGTQYYQRIQKDSGTMLIVLDARLELSGARDTLRSTAFIAGAACVILSIGAMLLIRRMVRPVQDAFDRQKQFVWDASHELKTPLAVISANVDVLESEIGENEYLGYIQSEVKRTDSLVQSLLTLARLDRQTVTAKPARMDLSHAVLGVALPFESAVFEAGKSLELDVLDAVYCMADEAMIQQLAVILMSNAVKYSESGGRIRLRVAQKGKNAVLSVYNTGAGIAPQDLDKIFDRFYRADASHNREVPGNGLGLSIAKMIVELNHGKIQVESDPEQGTEFTVTLPA